jgi:hypothetical protein
MLFSVVFLHAEPRPSVPILSGSANQNPRRFNLPSSRLSAHPMSNARPGRAQQAEGFPSGVSPSRFEKSFTINPLDATLVNLPVSVDSKSLTATLTPLDATLTKTGGRGMERAKMPGFLTQVVRTPTHRGKARRYNRGYGRGESQSQDTKAQGWGTWRWAGVRCGRLVQKGTDSRTCCVHDS